jgi:hypothetical protein
LLLLVVNRFDQHNLSFLGDEKKGQAIQSGLHNTRMSSKAGSTISEQIGAERRGGKGVATEQCLGPGSGAVTTTTATLAVAVSQPPK